MKLVFSDQAWEDYRHWQAHDAVLFGRINELIRQIQREPFAGIGKPEALKFALDGFWSRRTNHEQRIVYRVEDDVLMIAQLRAVG